jgi:hypothetical protein
MEKQGILFLMRSVMDMEAIQAYYDGNTFVPLAPVKMEPNQQVTLTIAENEIPEDEAFWDGVHDTLIEREARRLAGAPTYTHEQVWSKLEERYRAAENL